MKALLVLSVFASLSAFAVTARPLTGNVTISNEMISALGRGRGLRPMTLPVTVNGEVSGGTLEVAEFSHESVCLE